MPVRTVMIDVPDEFQPLLDRVLHRWSGLGKTPEITMLHALRHGLEMMDVGAPPDPSDPDITRIEGKDLPF